MIHGHRPKASSDVTAISGVILGNAEVQSFGTDEAHVAAFNKLLRYHGVAALFARGLKNSGEQDRWPLGTVEFCRREALLGSIFEEVNRRHVTRVLQALHDAGIDALLLKGAPLAHSIYEAPHLRARGDADILVPAHARGDSERVLSSLGFERLQGVSGELISYQSYWSHFDATGLLHSIDLHWQTNNAQVLSALLTYDELAARAIPAPAFGPHARTLSIVHALLFACIHRAGHRNAPYYVDGEPMPASERLIWLYDIHLLVSRMSSQELAEFSVLAAKKRLCWVCHDSLARSRALFSTPVPDEVMVALEPRGLPEPSARYCQGGRATQLFSDLHSLGTVSRRMRWLRELAFPPVEYMRTKYGSARLRWLPLLYVRRAVEGIWKLASKRTYRPAP